MILKFKGSYGWRDVACGIKEIREVSNLIKQDLVENYPHFKSYYTRAWMENGRLKFDVGDYVCFYYLELEEGETWDWKMEL